MSDGFSTSSIVFAHQSYEEYLNAFVNGIADSLKCFHLKGWHVIRCPPIYRERALSDLQLKYPKYKFSYFEASGILVEGNEEIFIRESIRQVETLGFVWFNDVGEHAEVVLKALCERFPEKHFELNMENEIKLVE